MVDRMRDALAGEMNRRQELLRSAGNYANVGDYEKARSAGAPLAPLPALFIVVDEFSELLSQQPEFADLFVAIGRLGRSLHMHLLLASQRLEEGKLRGLDSHLSYRIGLKTFSANESRTVLGVPDAYHLPAQPGVGYLKSDSAEILRFAASYVSGPYTGARRRTRITGPALASNLVPRLFTAAVVAPRPGDNVIAEYEDVAAAPMGETHTVLDTVIDRIRGQGQRAHEVWLPPLGASPTLNELISYPPDTRALRPVPATLRAPIGVVDRPYDQRREDLAIDLAGGRGHVAIVGGPQSGKSTALRSLILSMALTHTPEQIQFYALDFGGGTLAGLADLPHVGSVANRLDVDRVRRTVAEMTSIVAQREQHFRQQGIHSMVDFRQRRSASVEPDTIDGDSSADPFGDVFLVIDGWATIRSDYEPLEAAIAALVSQGLSYGVHLILTASRWAEIRPATKDLVGTRIELRLGDPSDSDVGRAKATLVPDNWPGRGITREGLHFLTALPRVDGIADGADLAAGVAHAVALVSEHTTATPAPPVRMLPEKYWRDDMLAGLTGSAVRWPPIDQRCVDEHGVPRAADRSVPIGVDEAELATVFLDFADQAHLLVFGDTACGKTTLLTGICDSLMRADTPRHTKIILGDYRRTMLGVVETDHLAGYAASQKTLTTMMNDLVLVLAERMPGPTITQQQLRERSWWTGPEIYVIVDDYDLVATPSGNPLLVLVDYLAHARDIGFHLLLARRSGGAARAMYDPVISRLKDLVSAGIVMSGSRDEGNLIGPVRPSEMPPGRGTLVTRHKRALIQIACSPP